jgi:hypothetical protein
MNKSMCGQYWQRITSWLSQMEGNCINSTWPFLCSLNISNLFLFSPAPRGAYTCLKKSMGMIFSKWAQKSLLNSWTMFFVLWLELFICLCSGWRPNSALHSTGNCRHPLQECTVNTFVPNDAHITQKGMEVSRVLGVVIQANMNVPW